MAPQEQEMVSRATEWDWSSAEKAIPSAHQSVKVPLGVGTESAGAFPSEMVVGARQK